MTGNKDGMMSLAYIPGNRSTLAPWTAAITQHSLSEKTSKLELPSTSNKQARNAVAGGGGPAAAGKQGLIN